MTTEASECTLTLTSSVCFWLSFSAISSQEGARSANPSGGFADTPVRAEVQARVNRSAPYSASGA